MTQLPPQFNDPIYKEAATVAQDFAKDSPSYGLYRRRRHAMELQRHFEVERDKAVQALDEALSQVKKRDEALEAKDHALEAKDRELEASSQALEAKDKQIQELMKKIQDLRDNEDD